MSGIRGLRRYTDCKIYNAESGKRPPGRQSSGCAAHQREPEAVIGAIGARHRMLRGTTQLSPSSYSRGIMAKVFSSLDGDEFPRRRR